MNSSVLCCFAKERARCLGLLGDILIKAIEIQQATCISMQKNCWGDENVSKAPQTKRELSVEDVRKNLGSAKLIDGSLMASFERKGKGAITFSTRQHTYMETRLVDTNDKGKYHLHFLAGSNAFNGWLRACEVCRLSMIQVSIG